MATPVLDVFNTTVINTSGVEKAFGYLGKHGMRLGVAEQVTIPGNLPNALAADHRTHRKFHALERDVANGRLAVIKTPAAFLYDSTANNTQVMGLTGGALGIALPSTKNAGLNYSTAVLTGVITAIPDGTVPIATATITFSQPVPHFSTSSLSLTRSAIPVPLTGVTVTSPDQKVWTVNGLAGLTITAGSYVLTVLAATFKDAFGVAMAGNATEPWVKT